MSKVEIYDKAMCCSTGVCGPQVDPELPRFAADLAWLQEQGHQVQRFNLAQHPEEYTRNAIVQQILESDGIDSLPLVFVDDRLVSRGQYPSRENLTLLAGTVANRITLPLATESDGCCGDSGCC